MKTYEIVEGGRAIKCLLCQRTSWNGDDVRYKFCVACDVFHDDVMLYTDRNTARRAVVCAADAADRPKVGR